MNVDISCNAPLDRGDRDRSVGRGRVVTARRSRLGRMLAGSLGGAVLLGAGGGLVAPPPAAADAPTVVTYGYTGAAQSWTVPVGVESATFTLNGAQGGQGGGYGSHTAGGRGGTLVATLPVIAGDSYTVVVGGQGGDALRAGAGGAGGFNGGGAGGHGPVLVDNGSDGGGGGGGATDLRYGGSGLADRLLVAGGGGGSSGSNSWVSGTVPIVQNPSQAGGAGGAAGDDATAGASDPAGGDGGGAGTSTEGGRGAVGHGVGNDWDGKDGAAGTGGIGGGALVPGGGGGGGGWFGGGGGANGANPNASADVGYQGAGGGGGGGSGHADASSATDVAATPGAHEGAGSVSISFVVNPDRVAPTLAGPGQLTGEWNVNFAYRYAVDGSPAPTTTITSGQLPPGLALRPDGTLAGVPTTSGAYTYTVTAANGVGRPASVTTTFLVLLPDDYATIAGTPPSARVGAPYDFIFTLGGNPAPTTTVTHGSLPPGITLGTDGHLSGTPTTAGSYAFTVTAEKVQSSVSGDYTIVVTADPPTVGGTPPVGTVGTAYDFTFTLGGPPASTTVTAGSLPPGITLGTDGHLTGTPTAAGTYPFTVTADDGQGQAVSFPETLAVQDVPVTITGTPPAAGVGEPYSFSFTTTGSPAVSRSAGTLPPGLALSSTGTLSGTPSAAGTFRFTVQAAGAGRSVTKDVALVVRSLPRVSIGDASVAEGNSGTKALALRVSLSRASSVPVTVRWSTVDGTARAGSDYLAASGTVTFAPGQTTGTVSVQVKGDRTRERPEGFAVRLSNPTHATVAKAVGLGVIRNDD